ncbi:hypothetical protein K470DRAFT_261148 [Piedraia hortae CBS 480.64]|uniref:Uncharacterized protein n=1 Tax=Piedraia hortae CBS 480.64 TaxID=1314780 RepID=A0A6A7BNZ7_9PEZI|nr:hypothetical protein K470DRAFT_261148 [Piedraia hortae CBS 480.64]
MFRLSVRSTLFKIVFDTAPQRVLYAAHSENASILFGITACIVVGRSQSTIVTAEEKHRTWKIRQSQLVARSITKLASMRGMMISR